MRAYHFLGGCTAREGLGGELVPHGGQVPIQQIQSGMHPGRIAVIPCLFFCRNTVATVSFRFHILLSHRGQTVLLHRVQTWGR